MIKYWLAKKMMQRKGLRIHLPEDLERRHYATDTPGFNNSIYFAGISPDWTAIITRMSFRSDKPDENWLKIYIRGEGVIGWENRSLIPGEGFRQGDLLYECISPGKEWKIKYHGIIREDQPYNPVKIDLTWRSADPLLDFNVEGVPHDNSARRIAAERWNPFFFKDLKGLGKIHYEQGGIISGTIEYKGIRHDLEMIGVRDHSYGIRNWDKWLRHMWLVGQLEDKRLFNISSIDYTFITDLKAGYLADRNGQDGTLNFTPGLGELVDPPSLPFELSFNIQKTKNESMIPVKVNMKHFFPFMMDDVYHIRQASAEFIIDGMKGRGIAEMGINLKRFPGVLQH